MWYFRTFSKDFLTKAPGGNSPLGPGFSPEYVKKFIMALNFYNKVELQEKSIDKHR